MNETADLVERIAGFQRLLAGYTASPAEIWTIQRQEGERLDAATAPFHWLGAHVAMPRRH